MNTTTKETITANVIKKKKIVQNSTLDDYMYNIKSISVMARGNYCLFFSSSYQAYTEYNQYVNVFNDKKLKLLELHNNNKIS